MARPKKVTVLEEIPNGVSTNLASSAVQIPVVVPTPIPLLSVDYPSEQLNDMARVLNILIERENERS